MSLVDYLTTALPPIGIRVDKTGKHPAVWEAKIFVCMIEAETIPGKWKVIGGVDARNQFELVLYDEELFPYIAETLKAYEQLHPSSETTLTLSDEPSL